MPAPVPIPLEFLERMRPLLGAEMELFTAALEGQPVSGLRVNTLKIPVAEFMQRAPFPLGKRIEWCTEATLVEDETRPGRHPWHAAGLYYLQDPSAMLPAVLLDPRPGERVLDLTAAPGGKTTQMAARMQGRGLLVANEIKEKRLGHLVMNVERWGAENIVITNESPENLADELGSVFDRVLVDAPCSGEGMFRKDMGARQAWSGEMVAGCALRQRNILRVAAHLVRPGGRLLFSTCTFAPEEDEGVIDTFLREHAEFHVQPVPVVEGGMTGRPDWVPGCNPSLAGAVRLFPHRLAGDGHFACLLERDGTGGEAAFMTQENLPRMNPIQRQSWQVFADETLAREFPEERLRVRGDRLMLIPENLPEMGRLRVTQAGKWLGTFKTGRFECAHPLALLLKSGDVQRNVELKSTDMFTQRYLRGETLPIPGAPGWVLVCVDGFGLGWGKRVQGVVKNHYPHGWMQA